MVVGGGRGCEFPRTLYIETRFKHISYNSQHISANKQPADNAQRLPLREHFLSIKMERALNDIWENNLFTVRTI
jgi:hypothetical protein